MEIFASHGMCSPQSSSIEKSSIKPFESVLSKFDVFPGLSGVSVLFLLFLMESVERSFELFWEKLCLHNLISLEQQIMQLSVREVLLLFAFEIRATFSLILF